MTNQPTNQSTTPAPAPEAPATSVAAPATQGTLGDKKLNVLIFDYDERDLKNHMEACTREGHKPIGVIVLNPLIFDNCNPEQLDQIRKLKGADYVIRSAEEAKAVVDAIAPNVITTTAMHDGGIAGNNQSRTFSDLMSLEIPDSFPKHIPALVHTVLGYTIHTQDGKEGQDLRSRDINLNAFLKAEAAKLNAQGRAQG